MTYSIERRISKIEKAHADREVDHMFGVRPSDLGAAERDELRARIGDELRRRGLPVVT